MGAPEEAGKAFSGVVDALKSTPVVMAILIFNFLYLALDAYQTIDARARFSTLIADVLSKCGPRMSPSSVVFKPPQEKLLFSLDPTLRDSSQPR